MKLPTSIALAILCLLQLVCLVRAPQVYTPAAIGVTLKPGQVQVLGRHELAAPKAAASHLAVRRDQAGNWWVRNISAGKAVLLRRDGTDRRMGASRLERGQQIRIGAAKFEVTASSARAVELSGAGHTWRYDGATLLRDGAVQDACPVTRATQRLGALWNRISPHALTIARSLTFGGNLRCGNRIAIPMLAGGSAVLARASDGVQLSNAGGSEAHAPLLVDGADVARQEASLAGVTMLTAGRTSLAVSITGKQLELRPLRNVALFTEQEAKLPEGVTWRWQARSAWALAGGNAWWVVLLLAACSAVYAAFRWQAGRWPFSRDDSARTQLTAAGSALLVMLGIGAVLLQRSGAPFGVGWSMLLAWAAMWTFLLAGGRAALASCAGVLLLAAGLLMQLELGLGAMESSWVRHFQKTGALLATGLGVATLVRLRLRSSPLEIPQLRLEWLLAGLAGTALLALAMQVVLGDETGVFDLQPVEFAKLALTALTAHCIAIGLGWQRDTPQGTSASLRWMRLGAPALLFAALLGLALLQVDDFSPLILLLVWAMVMGLAWSVAARRPLASAALAVVALTGVGAIAWLRLGGAAELGQWGFYADRFAVWLDPAGHPHTGQQLLLAARAIAQGAWWGADNWLGVAALGDAAGSALGIPAVQDDFAPTFFIHRHGLLGALALWVLQALFLVGLLQTAAGAFVASERARDFRQAWRWRLRCFVLCGGAAFVLGHLLLSWGTNLAIFPIMGQPMSFLSAGGSHLLFFICPLLAFNAISAQSLEENASCRSMSNTKSWAR